MLTTQGVRRSHIPGADPQLLRYAAGDSLATATFTRAGAATYTQQASDTLLRYQAGDSLAAATFARAGATTLHGNA
jgi:hypothetical protein